MSPMIRIIPRRDSVVRDPLTGKKLPPEGALVKALSPHWRRRLAEGGITAAPEIPATIPSEALDREES